MLADTDPHIVGHWKFDGASGITVTDHSANAKHGSRFRYPKRM